MKHSVLIMMVALVGCAGGEGADMQTAAGVLRQPGRRAPHPRKRFGNGTLLSTAGWPGRKRVALISNRAIG